MRYSRKKCVAVSMILFILFANIVFGEPLLLPEWFVNYYSNIIRITLLAVFLFAIKYFHNKKCLTVFAAAFALLMVTFTVVTSGVFSPFIEKIKNETPEAKVAAYVKAISNGNIEKALEFWEISESYELNPEYCNEIKDRGERITKELIKKGIKSDFTITHIEWWDTCCIPSITENSRIAGEAKVYVQLTDSDDIKSVYVFDIIVPGGYDGGLTGHSVRYWVISDIHPENQKSFFGQGRVENCKTKNA